MSLITNINLAYFETVGMYEKFFFGMNMHTSAGPPYIISMDDSI